MENQEESKSEVNVPSIALVLVDLFSRPGTNVKSEFRQQNPIVDKIRCMCAVQLFVVPKLIDSNHIVVVPSSDDESFHHLMRFKNIMSKIKNPRITLDISEQVYGVQGLVRNGHFYKSTVGFMTFLLDE